MLRRVARAYAENWPNRILLQLLEQLTHEDLLNARCHPDCPTKEECAAERAEIFQFFMRHRAVLRNMLR